MIRVINFLINFAAERPLHIKRRVMNNTQIYLRTYFLLFTNFTKFIAYEIFKTTRFERAVRLYGK